MVTVGKDPHRRTGAGTDHTSKVPAFCRSIGGPAAPVARFKQHAVLRPEALCHPAHGILLSRDRCQRRPTAAATVRARMAAVLAGPHGQSAVDYPARPTCNCAASPGFINRPAEAHRPEFGRTPAGSFCPAASQPAQQPLASQQSAVRRLSPAEAATWGGSDIGLGRHRPGAIVDQIANRFGRHGAAGEVTLHIVASRGAQRLALGIGFDAFRHDL